MRRLFLRNLTISSKANVFNWVGMPVERRAGQIVVRAASVAWKAFKVEAVVDSDFATRVTDSDKRVFGMNLQRVDISLVSESKRCV